MRFTSFVQRLTRATSAVPCPSRRTLACSPLAGACIAHAHPRPAPRAPHSGSHLGFGRIVASEIEAPDNYDSKLCIKWMSGNTKRQCERWVDERRRDVDRLAPDRRQPVQSLFILL